MYTVEELLEKNISDDAELAYVSVEFFARTSEGSAVNLRENRWAELLSFQNGWDACKDFYKINT